MSTSQAYGSSRGPINPMYRAPPPTHPRISAMSRSRRPYGGSARGMRHHTSHIIPNPSARRRSSGITMPRAGGAAAPRGAAALGRAPAAHLRSGPAHLSGLRRRDADPRVPHRARGSEVGAQGVLPGSASPLCLVHSGACRGRLACATPAISIAVRSSNPSGLRPRRTGAVSPFLRPALNGRIREVGRLPSRHRSSHLRGARRCNRSTRGRPAVVEHCSW